MGFGWLRRAFFVWFGWPLAAAWLLEEDFRTTAGKWEKQPLDCSCCYLRGCLVDMDHKAAQAVVPNMSPSITTLLGCEPVSNSVFWVRFCSGLVFFLSVLFDEMGNTLSSSGGRLFEWCVRDVATGCTESTYYFPRRNNATKSSHVVCHSPAKSERRPSEMTKLGARERGQRSRHSHLVWIEDFLTLSEERL